MGIPVTVDSDDLEKILQMSVAVGKIEQILEVHKKDPAIKRARDGFGDAHDKITRAWRSSKRGEQHAIWNKPLTDKEKTVLIDIATFHDVRVLAAEWASPNAPFIDLAAKGMIEAGTPCYATQWHGQERTEVKPEAKINPDLRVRITQRAITAVPELLRIIEAKNEKEEKKTTEAALSPRTLSYRPSLQTANDQKQKKAQEQKR